MDNNPNPTPTPTPDQEPTTTPQPEPALHPVATPIDQATMQAATAPNAAQPQPEKKSHTGLIIGIIVAVVVVLPIIGFILFFVVMAGIISSVELDDETIQEIESSINEIERSASDNYVAGVWNCAKGTGSEDDRDNFYTTIKLNENMTFQYGPYNDLEDNHYSGTYTFEDEDKKNYAGNYSYYMVTFNTKEFVVDGEEKDLATNGGNLSDMEMGITKTADGKQAITIFTSSYNMYYCYDY